MKLYLVQHAKARSKEEDSDRPLSAAGYTDIRRIAAFVTEQANMNIRQIFHNGKTRARQTAEVLGEALRLANGVQPASGLKALDDPVDWASRLVDINDEVMLVGHKPYLPRLAALLICQNPDTTVVDFAMGGVVCLIRDPEERWSVRWIITPNIVSSG
jgi:phosphohistidine phosphatase